MDTTVHDGAAERGDDHADLRAAYLAINDLGLALTRAIDRVGGHGLSANADVVVLRRLDAGPQRPRDLLESSGLTSAGLTNLFDRLEQRGLVARVHGSLDDRRGVLVEATPAGHELARAVRDTIGTTFDELAALRRRILRLVGAPTRRLRHAPPDEVIERLAALGDAMVQASTLDEHPLDPSPTRTLVVLAAAAEGGTRPREILARTTLSTGGVTQLLDRLEDEGLVTRTTGRPPDRRAVSVQPTPAGSTALARCMDRLQAYQDKIADAIA
jgi:DNA-binding MarR family transcriptional regulator